MKKEIYMLDINEVEDYFGSKIKYCSYCSISCFKEDTGGFSLVEGDDDTYGYYIAFVDGHVTFVELGYRFVLTKKIKEAS